MELDKRDLDKKFSDYYKKNKASADCVFIFSEDQARMSFAMAIGSGLVSVPMYVNGVKYCEQKSRAGFNGSEWKDAKIVAVGRECDITINEH